MASSNTVLIIVLIVLLLGLLGGLAYYFLVIKKKQAPLPPSAAQQPVVHSQTYVKPETTKISIPTAEAMQNQKNAPFDTANKISHNERMANFYRKLPTFGKDTNKILAALDGVDFERLDRGKLKDILERNSGMNFEESDFVINTLQKKYEEERTVQLIEKEYPHYHRLGLQEGDIRIHFQEKGYSDSAIQEGSRRFHQKNVYANYRDQLIKHMKVHVLAGKTDNEIISLFVAHNWPEALVTEALEKTKLDLEKENSVVYLQELILLELLEGDSKTKIVKALTKQGWPEDELKKEYADLDEGFVHLESALQMIDLNEYNLAKIKSTLKAKNWPDEIIQMTISKLIDDISYHKKLHKLNTEIEVLLNKGYNSIQIRNYLESQHWDRTIILKIIYKINKDLSKQGDKEKIKQFNNHVFVEDEWHDHMHEMAEQFETPKQPQPTMLPKPPQAPAPFPKSLNSGL